MSCDGHISEWWNSVKPLYSAGYTLKETRYYRRKFMASMTLDKRFQDSGPPEKITTIASVGTSASGPNAQQLALSVTLKTHAPRHWGRVYMPAPDVSRIDANGRWVAATRTTVANATAELLDDFAGSGFVPVVPVTQVNKQLVQGLAAILTVQVDDVPDVIRRRRAKTTLARTIGVPTA